MMNSTDILIRQKKIDRAKLINAAKESFEAKVALKEKAKRDIVFFVNQFCWTYDPRPENFPNHFSFLTYPFQDDYLLRLEESYNNNKDFLTIKSRDMGVSWMILVWAVWHWLFDSSFNMLIGSRKEDLVDNFQLDSLFGKIDYCVRRLPKYLLPKDFEVKKHRTFCKLINPERENSIQGESANLEFSRQGRYSCCMLDEFAFWQFAESVWTATADSSPVRIVVSTPCGKNNKFYDLSKTETINKVSLHWSLHPYKTKEWYEDEKKRRTPREIAQELDMDFEASGAERVFDIRSNQELRQNVYIDPFDIPESWKLRAGLDYGTRNVSAFHVFAQDHNSCSYAIWEWRRNLDDLKKEGFFGSMVQAIAWMLVYKCPYYDIIDHVRADPSLWVKNQNSPDGMVSIIQQIQQEISRLIEEEKKNGKERKKIGFIEGAQNDLACIERTKSLWSDVSDPLLKIFRSCSGLMTELDELMWQDWSEVQQQSRSIKEKIEDKNNHSWDAWKYYIMSKPAPPLLKQQQPRLYTYKWFENKSKLTENNKLRNLR
ncbi:MAG: hypothetical protein KKB38_20325 [Gammaproteobacteria bacterium]|nr:hypothetical protein [Gammaproteobacteria bacterium]